MPAISTGLALGLGAIGSIGGAAISAIGAGKQASAAERSSEAAIAEQRRQFDITQKNLQPWLTGGTQAMQTLQFLLGLGVPPDQAVASTSQATGISPQQLSTTLQRLRAFRDPNIRGNLRFLDGAEDRFDFDPSAFEPSGLTSTARPGGPIPAGRNAGDFGSLMRDFSAQDFQTDPGYDFRLSEGAKALERSAAARGTVLSGGTLKQLARYNQDFASNEFGNAYNRFQSNRATRFNQLASIAGLGQTTATQLGNLGAQNAASVGNLIVGGQTAAAAARASGYNAFGNAIGNAGNLPLNWLLLSQLNAGGTPPLIPAGDRLR